MKPTRPHDTADEHAGDDDHDSEQPTDDAEGTPDLTQGQGDEVFRLMTVRSPQTVPPERVVQIQGDDSGGLVDELDAAADSSQPRRKSARTLASYTTGAAFVDDLADLELALEPVRSQLETSPPADAAGFGGLVEEETGATPVELVESEPFQTALGRLVDSLIATSLHPVTAGDDVREILSDGIRILDAIEQVARTDDLMDPSRILSRTVSLPDTITPLPELESGTESTDNGAPTTRIGDIADLRSNLTDVQGAREELLSAVTDHGGRTNGAAATVSDVDEATTDGQHATEPGATEHAEAGGATDQCQNESDERSTDATADPIARFRQTFLGGEVGRQVERAFDDVSGVADELQATGLGQSTVVTDETFAQLSDDARSKLTELDVTPGAAPVDTTVERLDDEATTLNTQLLDATVGASEQLLLTGQSVSSIEGAVQIPELVPNQPLDIPDVLDSPLVNGDEDETERAGVTALGFGELRSVTEVGPEYRAGEIAHVENVMATETRERVHESTEITEEETREEQETIESENEDLQTTQRHEIKRETEQVIQQESELHAGVSVSASYGQVELESSFGYARRNAKERAQQTAVETAKEITHEATRRVEERVTSETIRRVREEVSERNLHAFENDTDDHVVGIYRWLEKVYRMDVLEYDEPRLMFEFLIPDPAAAYRHAMAEDPNGTTLQKPVEPKAVKFLDGDVDEGAERGDDDVPIYLDRLSYDDITSTNYRWYASHYGAEDVPEPPAERKREVVHITGGTEEMQTAGDGEANVEPIEAPHYDTAFIDVPDGYRVWHVDVLSDVIHRRDHDYSAHLRVSVGADHPGPESVYKLQDIRWDTPAGEQKSAGAAVRSFPINTDAYDELPVTVIPRNTFGYNVVAAAMLVRTQDALREWQATVYDAIVDAYERRLDEYRSQLEAARIGAGVTIEGNNPAENRQTERTELKRAAIELLREQELDVDAIDPPDDAEDGNSDSFPTIDPDALAGMEKDLQFFELAFEWQEGTYVFYPYYWAEQATWADKLNRDDPDPKFESFLTAGAARFVVPVRPGFEPNVLQFMETGVPFLEEGSIDSVNDPRYVDIVSELRERDEGAADASYTHDSWYNTVPTSLVKLQGSADLPNLITPTEELYPEAE